MEVWKQIVESKRIQAEQDKTKYCECEFRDASHEVDVEVRLDTQVIPKRGCVKYFESSIESNGENDDDAAHHVGVGWEK